MVLILVHSPKSQPVAIRTRFFVFTKFRMHNVSHMHVHRIHDPGMVHLFNSLGPRPVA